VSGGVGLSDPAKAQEAALAIGGIGRNWIVRPQADITGYVDGEAATQRADSLVILSVPYAGHDAH